MGEGHGGPKSHYEQLYEMKWNEMKQGIYIPLIWIATVTSGRNYSCQSGSHTNWQTTPKNCHQYSNDKKKVIPSTKIFYK